MLTPEQGKQLTAIELFINMMLDQDRIEGFEAAKPRAKETAAAAEAPKPNVPVFGQRTRRLLAQPLAIGFGNFGWKLRKRLQHRILLRVFLHLIFYLFWSSVILP